MSNYSWAESDSSLILPNEKATVLIPANLDLNCSPVAEANQDIYFSSSTDKFYIVPKNASNEICVWKLIDVIVYSPYGFRYEQTNLSYPYFSEKYNIDVFPFELDSNTLVLQNVSQLPLDASPATISSYSPDALCRSHLEPFEWCYEQNRCDT